MNTATTEPLKVGLVIPSLFGVVRKPVEGLKVIACINICMHTQLLIANGYWLTFKAHQRIRHRYATRKHLFLGPQLRPVASSSASSQTAHPTPVVQTSHPAMRDIVCYTVIVNQWLRRVNQRRQPIRWVGHVVCPNKLTLFSPRTASEDICSANHFAISSLFHRQARCRTVSPFCVSEKRTSSNEISASMHYSPCFQNIERNMTSSILKVSVALRSIHRTLLPHQQS